MQKILFADKSIRNNGGGVLDIEGLSEYTYSALWPF